MRHLTTALLNGTLVHSTFLINLFFVYCLVRPASPEKIKQPLKILLHTMVSCNIFYLVTLLSRSFSVLASDQMSTIAFFLLAHGSVSTSMTSATWLIFFYYTKVVPARRALSVWVKKNTRVIIYSAWIFERLWTLSDITFLIFRMNNLMSANSSANQSHVSRDDVCFFFVVSSCLYGYFFLSMFLMVWASASISFYLIGHVQRMRASGESFSCPKFHRQLRVAVTGFVQGLLHLVCALWIVFKFIYEQVYFRPIDSNFHFTIINMYVFGTTVNMWAGLAVFRQKTLDVVRALRCRRRGGHNDASDGG